MVDNGGWQKQKSSGIIICPGTGSTSWHLNINHVSFQEVQQILQVGKICTVTAIKWMSVWDSLGKPAPERLNKCEF